MKICLSCSHGGHCVQMGLLMPAFEGYDVFLVTTKQKMRNLNKEYYIRETWDIKSVFSVIPYIVSVLLISIASFRILIKEKPDIIVTTGADCTIPICYIGKLFGAKVIYIESLSRIHEPSGSGRAIYPIADLFLVQWEPLLKKYGKKARYGGRVI